MIGIKKATLERIAFCLCPGSELNRYGHCWPQDFKSCVSTNFTTRAIGRQKKSPLCQERTFGAEDRARTGHPDLGKVVLYQMSYFRVKELNPSFGWGHKIKGLCNIKKAFLVTCILGYIGCFPGQVRQFFCTSWYRALSKLQIEKQLNNPLVNRTEIRKKLPSYV